MYQLIQIPFQNFFSILCTNRSPSPFDFHSSETSADPHHVTDTPNQTKPNQATLAPPHTRRYVPIPPRSHAPLRLAVLPTIPPYHRTVLSTVLPAAPPHRTPNRTTAPPHRTLNCTLNCTPNRTTAPPHRTPRHTLTPPRPHPHHPDHIHTTHTTSTPPTPHPHHIIPPPCNHTIPTPAGRFDAVPTQHRRSIDAAPTPSRRRTGAAPDATGARVAGPPPTPATALMPRTPDTGTPLAVPVCRARLRYPLVGRVVVRPKAGQRTGSVSQAPAICHTLRTAHRIPRRPAGPTLVGPGRRVPLSPASPAPSPSCASDTGTGQVQVH